MAVEGRVARITDPDSSVGGLMGRVTAYAASKVTVNLFTVHLARELADTPIKVNAADPGWVRTDMGGPLAPLPVAEGAETGVWLATLPADGPSGRIYHRGEPQPW